MAADSVTWTDEMYRIFGLDPERFPATFEGYLASVHPDDRNRIKGTIEQAIAEISARQHTLKAQRGNCSPGYHLPWPKCRKPPRP